MVDTNVIQPKVTTRTENISIDPLVIRYSASREDVLLFYTKVAEIKNRDALKIREGLENAI